MSGSAPKPEIIRLTWAGDEKMKIMEPWAQNVMADTEVSKPALRVAWALMFYFNSKQNIGCWKTNKKIGEMAGIGSSAVADALALLEKLGHIERTQEPRDHSGKLFRIVYPTLNRAVQDKPARQRRGGVAKGVNTRRITTLEGPEGQDRATGMGPEVQDPWGPEGQEGGVLTLRTHVSRIDHGKIQEAVQGVRTRISDEERRERAAFVERLFPKSKSPPVCFVCQEPATVRKHHPKGDFLCCERHHDRTDPLYVPIEPDRIQRDPAAPDDPSSNLPAGQEAFEDGEASTVEPGSPPIANAELEDEDFDDDIPDPATLRASR